MRGKSMLAVPLRNARAHNRYSQFRYSQFAAFLIFGLGLSKMALENGRTGDARANA